MKPARDKKPLPYLQIRARGKRLEIRPYQFSDFKKCAASHAGRLPHSTRFDHPIPVAEVSDPKMFRERLKRHRRNAKAQTLFVFGVFEKKSGAYIGQIDLMTISSQLRWANLGYQIQNQFTGNGYATEAARLGLKVAFQHLGFHRVEAAMELDHRASQKVAVRAGLVPEGIRRKFFAARGGVDMKVFATNAIDFKRARDS